MSKLKGKTMSTQRKFEAASQDDPCDHCHKKWEEHGEDAICEEHQTLTVRIVPVGASGKNREIWQVKLLGQWLRPLHSFQRNHAISHIKRTARRWGYKQLQSVHTDSDGKESKQYLNLG